jgi:hypothetical protein
MDLTNIDFKVNRDLILMQISDIEVNFFLKFTMSFMTKTADNHALSN